MSRGSVALSVTITDYWRDFRVFAAEFERLNVTETSKVYFGATFRPKMRLEMGKNTTIGTNAIILVPSLIMHDGSQINAGAILFGREPIIIGKNSVISYGCVLGTSSDTTKGEFMNDASPEEKRCIKSGPITIGHNVFIGAKAVIMPGVCIGDDARIGSGCYISHNIPAGTKILP